MRTLLLALAIGWPSLAVATPVTLVRGEWQRVTLGNSDVLTQVTIPAGSRRLWVRFMTNAGKITHTGTDGGAIGSHYGTFAADLWVDARFECAGWGSRDVNNLGCSVYLASATGSTVVELYATAADS